MTLTKGAKSTFIRELNFNDAENFTSDYYIYDAEGKEIAKIKKVTMEELVLPVYSVGFGCSKVSGEAVLLDDFKMYPTKVGYDFELYDAKTGMQIKELDTANACNTAFRFSWLNATNQEKSYTVMAAYYNGDTLVEEKAISEVKMAPNDDGITTGIVENKTDGQTVKVYLKDNNPAEDEETPNQGGDVTEKPEETDKTLLIIIIAATAAVMVVAVVVIIIVASKKKKTAKPDAE